MYTYTVPRTDQNFKLIPIMIYK